MTTTAAPQKPAFVIGSHGRHLEVISLAEALRRRGFPICNLHADAYTVEQAEEIMVGYDPEWTAHLNPGGEPWAFCGGPILFSLCEVQLAKTGWWYFITRSHAVVIETLDKWPHTRLSLVQPC